jgi:hypothetical protein
MAQGLAMGLSKGIWNVIEVSLFKFARTGEFGLLPANWN